jgi:hypothetical protein
LGACVAPISTMTMAMLAPIRIILTRVVAGGLYIKANYPKNYTVPILSGNETSYCLAAPLRESIVILNKPSIVLVKS